MSQRKHKVQRIEHSVPVPIAFGKRRGVAGQVATGLQYLDDVQPVELSVSVGITGNWIQGKNARRAPALPAGPPAGRRIQIAEDFTADGAGILDFYGEGDTFGGQASGTIVVFNGLRIEDSTPAVPLLQAGDADMDWDFDQLDLVQVQIAAKYLSGQAATSSQTRMPAAPFGTFSTMQ